MLPVNLVQLCPAGHPLAGQQQQQLTIPEGIDFFLLASFSLFSLFIWAQREKGEQSLQPTNMDISRRPISDHTWG